MWKKYYIEISKWWISNKIIVIGTSNYEDGEHRLTPPLWSQKSVLESNIKEGSNILQAMRRIYKHELIFLKKSIGFLVKKMYYGWRWLYTPRVIKLWPVSQIRLTTCFVNKVLLKHSHTHFTYFFNCFCITMAELNSCQEELMNCNA